MKVNFDGQLADVSMIQWGSSPMPFQKLFERKFVEPGAHWIEVVNDLSGSEITIDTFV